MTAPPLLAWAASDPGRVRQNNEDGFLADVGLGLFIVGDGMGGHAAGETASSEALKEIHRYLVEHRLELEELDLAGREPPSALRQRTLHQLELAVQSACSLVFGLASANPKLRGMGTTSSLILVRGQRAYLAHVGDSRIYLQRGTQLHLLTEAHTVLAELLRRNRLDPEAVKKMPYKHSLSRAVGTQSTVEVDTVDLEVVPGDQFVLCTDGLSEYLEDPGVLSRLLSQGPLAGAPARLVHHANEQGGKDNVTALVVEIQAPTADRDTGTEAHQHQLRMDTLGSISLLKHLTYKELIQIFNITEPRTYPPGATILQEGEPGDALYILMKGQARVRKGREQVAMLGRGDHFGEMALVDQSPRSASVEATTPVQARVIRRDPFYELLRSDPLLSSKILWNFLQVLSSRLRDSSAVVEQLRQQLAQTKG